MFCRLILKMWGRFSTCARFVTALYGRVMNPPQIANLLHIFKLSHYLALGPFRTRDERDRIGDSL
jgi:hypothetical protein